VTAEKFAYRATLEEIRENDYNLHIPRYVDTFEVAAAIDLPAVQQEIDDLQSQLATVRTEMRGRLK
jgi:type I restriction enzyme M protein